MFSRSAAVEHGFWAASLAWNVNQPSHLPRRRKGGVTENSFYVPDVGEGKFL